MTNDKNPGGYGMHTDSSLRAMCWFAYALGVVSGGIAGAVTTWLVLG